MDCVAGRWPPPDHADATSRTLPRTVRPIDSQPNTSPIQRSEQGGLLLSGEARLSDVAASPLVRDAFPLLASACEREHTNAGDGRTLASSLAPDTRCRRTGDAVACAVNGSALCAARDPTSPLHAILDGGPCWRAFRSLTGVALAALDAAVALSDSDTGWLSTDEFFEKPDDSAPTETRPAGTVLRVKLPAAAGGGYQRLILDPREDAEGTVRMSIAAVQRADGDVRLVLGGVAPRPYRVYTSVEEEAMAGGLDEEAITGLADRALLDADTDPHSANRLDAAAALLRLAIEEIAANQRPR